MKKRRTVGKMIGMWVFVCICLCCKSERVAAITYDPATCFYLSTVHEPVMMETIGDENECNITNGIYVCRRSTNMLYNGDVYANVIFYGSPTTFSMAVMDTAGNVRKNITVLSTDSKWCHLKGEGSDTQDGYSYTLQFPFEEKQSFDIQMTVLQKDLPAQKVKYRVDTLQYEFTSGPKVTVGFTRQLTAAADCDMNTAVAKWTSSKPSIATVSSKGVVKGKKKGKTVITAHFANGTTASKTVEVIPNEYTKEKLKKKDVKKGSCDMEIHSIYYDKAGNLVIKANLINKMRNIYKKN